MGFCLLLLKTLTDSEYCSESFIRISVPAFRVSHWSISSSFSTFFACWWKDPYPHKLRIRMRIQEAQTHTDPGSEHWTHWTGIRKQQFEWKQEGKRMWGRRGAQILSRTICVGHRIMAGFRNNFQNHRRLSEQLLESQAAIGKPEQASWRVLLEEYVVIKWFHRCDQKLYFGFSWQKGCQQLWKPSALQKYPRYRTDLISRRIL